MNTRDEHAIRAGGGNSADGGGRGASDDVRALAARVRILLCDVDGVMTDGGIFYLEDGTQAVRFHVRDGLALAMAKRAGIVVGLVSGRPTPQVRRRASDLGLDEVHLDVRDKAPVVADILARRGFDAADACYIGDDLIDLPAMALVGFPVAVADAVPAVRSAARYVTTERGGHGAVRELVDLLLSAR